MKSSNKRTIYDIGCGNAKAKGSIGVDRVKLPQVDIVHNLNSFPWPMEDNSADEMILNDIIEHLDDQLKLMEEIHRILKIGGLVHIRVVYWNHKYSFSDPTHVHYFSEINWEFFTGKRRNYYTNSLFKIQKFQYIYNPKVWKYIRSKKIIHFLSNYLCNIIQGMKISLKK